MNAASPGAAPALLGYGTGYSTGFPALTYGGSLVPTSALKNYLMPGPTGFVSVNYAAILKASNYAAIDNAAIAAVGHPGKNSTVGFPYSTSDNLGTVAGTIDEKTTSLYAELNGVWHLDHDLRYNAGVRWYTTQQDATSPVTHVDPRNPSPATGADDGARYPNTFTFATASHRYNGFLPSFNVVYQVSDEFQLRAAWSRTITRPAVASLVAGINFGDQAAAQASLGNPGLQPFFSSNIDIGGEYYTGGEGYIGFAFFDKQIRGFTTNTNVTQPFSYLAQFGITYDTLNAGQKSAIDGRGGPGVATIQVSQPVNQPGVERIDGLELDLVQPLDFLLERHGLKGFGITANATLIDQSSTGSLPTFATGVPHLAWNSTLYYENHGLSARVSYTWTGKTYLSNTGNNQGICLPSTAAVGCPGGANNFSAAYGQMDFSSSYELSHLIGKLPSNPEVTFDIQNALDAKLRTFDQFTNATHSYYNQGKVYLIGVRGTF